MEDLKQYNSISSFEPVFAKKVNNDLEKKEEKQKENEQSHQHDKSESTATAVTTIKNKSSNLTVDDLIKMGNDFLASVNKKRAHDETINEVFEKNLSDWSHELAVKIKEIARLEASKYSQIISEKFNLISEDLEQIEKLEQDLVKISKEVEDLYNAINLND